MTNFWEIETGIDMPEIDNLPFGKKSKYPFSNMEVGDSVFFEGMTSQSNPVVYAHNYGIKSGKKFSSRKQSDGVRVWRVK